MTNHVVAPAVKTTGDPDYKIIEFEWPIKENADLIPKPIKQHFLQPGLVPAASKMLQELVNLDIIARGYSIFDAATYFVPKPRRELTLKEFEQQGGKKENFVPGMENPKAPQSIRMVNHFQALNDACYNSPVIQQSTSQQLRRISTQIT